MNSLIPYTQANIWMYPFSTSVKSSTLLITISSFKNFNSIKAANPPLHGFSPIYVIENKWLGSTKTLSPEQTVTHSVPQGSVLGPLLFLLSINDLPLHATIGNMHIFADDVTTSVGATEVQTVNDQLQKECQNIKSWCTGNRMVVNVEKTKSMIIASQQKLRNSSDPTLNITIQSKQILNVPNEKLLGSPNRSEP